MRKMRIARKEVMREMKTARSAGNARKARNEKKIINSPPWRRGG